ncbi:MAG TPA: hypothetical protein PK760_08195, partial [Flavobacteriales bacterium]|nr:hypothetical protein [Flavobacteriales bacterium]
MQRPLPLAITCLSLVFSLCDHGTQAQQLTWANQFLGQSDVVSASMAVDAAGNVFTTGHFYGTVDMDPGVGEQSFTAVGLSDIFVCKVSASGAFVWAQQFGGDQDEQAYSIDVDGAGNVYFAGEFLDTVDFDPGSGVFELSASTVGGGVPYAAFACKLDPIGNLLWARKIGSHPDDATPGDVRAFAIAVDPTGGNAVVVGTFADTLLTSPGTEIQLGSIDGYSQGFVMTFQTNSGDAQWGGQLDGASNSSCNTVAIDAAGAIVTGGTFDGATDFDPGVGLQEETSTGGFDGFVLKLAPGGVFDWVRAFVGGAGEALVAAVCLDNSANIISTGSFTSHIDFAGTILSAIGGGDIFVVKFNATGDLQWARQMAGPLLDEGHAVTTDGAGSVYTTGFYAQTADLDPGPGNFDLVSNSDNDVPFVNKLDANGDFVWAVSFDAVDGARGLGIGLDAQSSIYTTGYFSGTVDFDPQGGSFPLTSGGNRANAFVHKMCQGITTSIAPVSCGPYLSPGGSTYATSGTYQETISGGLNCDTLLTIDLTVITLDTMITVSGSGDTLTAAPNLSYQWLDCTNGLVTIVGETGASYAPTVNGTYAVAVSSNGCTDTSSCHAVIVLTTRDLQHVFSISAQPNPTGGTITVDLL